METLCIAASINHFTPYIIQSEKITQILTDNRPCVQAYDKLKRGEFSNSPQVTTYLSMVSGTVLVKSLVQQIYHLISLVDTLPSAQTASVSYASSLLKLRTPQLELFPSRMVHRCHLLVGLPGIPPLFLLPQSSEPEPNMIGTSFAADVMCWNKQFVLVLRETVSSFTRCMFIGSEDMMCSRMPYSSSQLISSHVVTETYIYSARL